MGRKDEEPQIPLTEISYSTVEEQKPRAGHDADPTREAQEEPGVWGDGGHLPLRAHCWHRRKEFYGEVHNYKDDQSH